MEHNRRNKADSPAIRVFNWLKESHVKNEIKIRLQDEITRNIVRMDADLDLSLILFEVRLDNQMVKLKYGEEYREKFIDEVLKEVKEL